MAIEVQQPHSISPSHTLQNIITPKFYLYFLSFLQGYTRIIGYFVGYTSLIFFLWGYTNLNLSFVKSNQKHYFWRESQFSSFDLLNYSLYSVWYSVASITFIFLQLRHCHFVAHSRVPTKSKAENLTFSPEIVFLVFLTKLKFRLVYHDKKNYSKVYRHKMPYYHSISPQKNSYFLRSNAIKDDDSLCFSWYGLQVFCYMNGRL